MSQHISLDMSDSETLDSRGTIDVLVCEVSVNAMSWKAINEEANMTVQEALLEAYECKAGRSRVSGNIY